MQTDLLLWLQSIRHPVLDSLMIATTNLGSETTYILLIAFVYWCYNKQTAFKWMNVLMISAFANAIIKIAVHAQRPFQVNSAIKGLYTVSATSFSFPSGHSMNAGANLTWAIRLVKNKKFTAAAVVLMLLIGFSRLYLGVHWPQDVIIGLIFGCCIAFLYEWYCLKFPNYIELPALFLAIAVAAKFRDEASLKLLGTFFGGIMGYWLGEYIFKIKSHPWKQGGSLKYFIGVVIVLVVHFGLKMILPEGMTTYRYSLVGFTLTFAWPWIFEKVYKEKTGEQP